MSEPNQPALDFPLYSLGRRKPDGDWSLKLLKRPVGNVLALFVSEALAREAIVDLGLVGYEPLPLPEQKILRRVLRHCEGLGVTHAALHHTAGLPTEKLYPVGVVLSVIGDG